MKVYIIPNTVHMLRVLSVRYIFLDPIIRTIIFAFEFRRSFSRNYPLYRPVLVVVKSPQLATSQLDSDMSDSPPAQSSGLSLCLTRKSSSGNCSRRSPSSFF